MHRTSVVVKRRLRRTGCLSHLIKLSQQGVGAGAKMSSPHRRRPASSKIHHVE